ncbi:hypothetical protein GSI_00906 [Ganoderma sinense ZZ0214-1]|uniref:Uncharacterized protein n=1 Tax=Ganoderma sinense ZZ0214-1 TaxID=1077348 RepID=A0A2G8SU26_9APHY|nr:hypothetical protein GSI_00906 [Ganoderma sinense ZZ0214-1]
MSPFCANGTGKKQVTHPRRPVLARSRSPSHDTRLPADFSARPPPRQLPVLLLLLLCSSSGAETMLRTACPPLTGVTRRLSTLTGVRGPATSTVSQKASPPKSRIPPRNAEAAQKPWKGKAKERSEQGGGAVSKPKRLLKPYELALRLTKLCDEGKMDEAIETLKNMPLDAQNTVVWSTMISRAGRAGRFQLAYQLYIDMKRRGLKPVLRTFTTLMGAFMRVQSWEDRTKLLQNVHKTYENFLEYVELVKNHNPQSPEYSVAPINAYLSILSRANQRQRMFDVYNSLDQSGPLSPNIITYTVMLGALGYSSMVTPGDDPAAPALRERNASDARLVWRQLTKRLEQDDTSVPIDAPLISSLLPVLALGRPADQVVAFDVLREYVGLAKPGETAPAATVKLTAALLSDVLWLCNATKKHRLCVTFVQQLIAQEWPLLDRGHMDHVLSAYGALAATGSTTEAARALQMLEWMIEREVTSDLGHIIRPGLSTYTLVLVACWRAKDWDSTMRTFELMTGFRAQDFADGATDTPQQTVRSHGKNLLPDVAAASCIARTALETKDEAAMRQCLRIAHHLNLTQYLSTEKGEAEAEPPRVAPRFKKDNTFYTHKMASALVGIVDALVPKRTDGSPRLEPEARNFVAIRSAARSFLITQRHQRPGTTPVLEEQLWASDESLSKMDSAVQWDRISREQKTHSRSF